MVEEILCCFCKACMSMNCQSKCTCSNFSCTNNCFKHLCGNDCCKNSCFNCSGSEFNLFNCLCHCKFFEGECCIKIEEDCLTAFKFTENISSCSGWFQGICGNISNSLFNCFSSVRCCFPDICLLTLGYNFNLGNASFEEEDDEEEEKKKKEENKRKIREEEKINHSNKETRRDEDNKDDNDYYKDDNDDDKDDNYHEDYDYDADKEQIIIQVGDCKIDYDATKQNDNFVIENEYEYEYEDE